MKISKTSRKKKHTLGLKILVHQKKINESLHAEMNLDNNNIGNDLDVPGAELDDDYERIGSKDDENNYYSLSSDNHIDLEEHKHE